MAAARGVFGRSSNTENRSETPMESRLRMPDRDTDEELWVSRSLSPIVAEQEVTTENEPDTLAA